MILPHAKRVTAHAVLAKPTGCFCGGRRLACIRLNSINHNRLTLIRPLIRFLHQSCSNWILTNVFPFFGVAVLTSQDVIEESWLPKLSGQEKCVRNCALQSGYPLRQYKLDVTRDK